MTAAYEVASRVLSAAADGETVAGFESVGELLIDLRRTTPVASGSALGTSAVAAATAASTPRFTTLSAPDWLRPHHVVLGLVGVLVAGYLVLGGPRGSSAEIGPADDLAPDHGGVDGGEPGDGGPDPDQAVARVTEPGDGTADSDPSTTVAPTTAAPQTTGASSPTATAGRAPTTTESPTTTGLPTTTGSPTTTVTTTTPATTSVPTTTTVHGGGTGERPEQDGNNGKGNDNGKGAGSGNGNSGKDIDSGG